VLDPRAAYKAAAPPRRGPLSEWSGRLDGQVRVEHMCDWTPKRFDWFAADWGFLRISQGDAELDEENNEGSAGKAQSKNQPSQSQPAVEPAIRGVMQAQGSPAHQQSADEQDEREDRRAMVRYTRQQSFFAGCIAVLSLAAAFVGYLQWDATDKQWDAMKKQNELAEDTAKKQLRAWIGIESTQVAWDQTTETLQAATYFKNYGQTPGYSVQSFVDYRLIMGPFSHQIRPRQSGLAVNSKCRDNCKRHR